MNTSSKQDACNFSLDHLDRPQLPVCCDGDRVPVLSENLSLIFCRITSPKPKRREPRGDTVTRIHHDTCQTSRTARVYLCVTCTITPLVRCNSGRPPPTPKSEGYPVEPSNFVKVDVSSWPPASSKKRSPTSDEDNQRKEGSNKPPDYPDAQRETHVAAQPRVSSDHA